MRSFIGFFLSIPLCFSSIPLGFAGTLPGGGARLQVIDNALDRIEAALSPQVNVPPQLPVQPYFPPAPVQPVAVRQEYVPPGPVVLKAAARQPLVPKANTFEYNIEAFSSRFSEPGTFSQKGFMSGYNFAYAHRFANPRAVINMFSIQGQWAKGKFKQPPGVGPSGIKDDMYNLKATLGKDFYPAANVRTTAYTGFGYRYLKDNSEGLSIISDGFTLVGDKRYSHYLYVPFGLDMVWQPSKFYSLQPGLEYDYLAAGWQVSKLGVVPGYNTFVFDQRRGFGLAASLRVNFYFKYTTAFVEGFYRFWDIGQSKSKPDPTDPTLPPFNEPKNHTQEFGLRLGLDV